jgi:hypothetical protein
MRIALAWIVVIVSLLAPDTLRAETAWEVLERVDDGASGYVLSRRPARENGIATYLLVTTVDAPPWTVADAAIAFLTQARYTPEGQRRTLLRSGEHEVLTHLQIEVPLASDRDVTTRVVLAEKEGVHRLQWLEVEAEGPDPIPGPPTFAEHPHGSDEDARRLRVRTH